MVEALGDAFWVMFNLVFIWFAIRYIGALKPFVKAQTLGWPMKWVMAPMVVAFALMTVRILQVNYMKLVLGLDPRDPALNALVGPAPPQTLGVGGGGLHGQRDEAHQVDRGADLPGVLPRSHGAGGG